MTSWPGFGSTEVSQQRDPARVAESTCSTRSAAWLVAIVVLAFLGSIAGLGYATLDDRWYAAWVWNQSWTTSAYDLAVLQGKLLTLSSYSYYFPYLIESAWVREILRLGTILVAAWLAGNILQRVLRARGCALLFTLLFFALAQNSNDHNLFVAYPFAWEFSWLTWLAGLLGLLVAIDRGSLRYAVCGALLCLVGLQEAFVPHTIVYVAVAILAQRRGQPGFRCLVPYLIGLGAWLAVWVAWRSDHASVYAGSQLAIGSPATVFLAMFNYSLGGAPLATLFHATHPVPWRRIPEEIGTLSVIKAVAVFAAAWRLSLIGARARFFDTWKSVCAVAVVLAALVVLPNVLIAATPKYQEWMRVGVRAYLYSHFSFFAWIALMMVIALAVLSRWRSRALAGVFALLIASGAVVTDAANAGINRQQLQVARRWNTIENLLRSEEFRSVPAGSVIWMVDPTVAGSAAGDAAYWDFVVRARSPARVLVTSDVAVARASSVGAYYLYLYDEPETENQYVLFARIEENQGRWTASSISIFPNSRNRRINVSGPLVCAASDCIASIQINSKPTGELVADRFAVTGEAIRDANDIERLQLRIDAGADVLNVRADFARNPPPSIAAVSASTGQGFYGWETDGAIRWNWSTVDSELQVTNGLARNVHVDIEFWLVGGDARSVRVSDSSGNTELTVEFSGEHPGFATVPVEVPPGATRLLLHTATPPLSEHDGRKLAYQIRDLSLRLRQPNPPHTPPE